MFQFPYNTTREQHFILTIGHTFSHFFLIGDVDKNATATWIIVHLFFTVLDGLELRRNLLLLYAQVPKDTVLGPNEEVGVKIVFLKIVIYLIIWAYNILFQVIVTSEDLSPILLKILDIIKAALKPNNTFSAHKNIINLV